MIASWRSHGVLLPCRRCQPAALSLAAGFRGAATSSSGPPMRPMIRDARRFVARPRRRREPRAQIARFHHGRLDAVRAPRLVCEDSRSVAVRDRSQRASVLRPDRSADGSLEGEHLAEVEATETARQSMRRDEAVISPPTNGVGGNAYKSSRLSGCEATHRAHDAPLARVATCSNRDMFNYVTAFGPA